MAQPTGDALIHNGRDILFDAEAMATLGLNEHNGAQVSSRADTALPVHIKWSDLTFDVPQKNTKTASDKSKKRKKGDAVDDDVLEEPDEVVASAHDDADEPTPIPTTMKRVLHGVNGEVRPGQFLAIMGASGAGKSTLLNLLAGRLQSSKNCVSGGRVLVNGKKRDFQTFNKIACYVEQDDTMYGELTVEEQLMYSAMLRLPSSMSREQKRARVDAIIQELGLSKCRKTFIGNEFLKGVSGGERKRVSIGTELVADPSLCVLDEPTTGLDAFNAMNVMVSLRRLASNGRTVISTIHQPRSSIFQLFDYLLVLSEGRSVFFGPASDASSYFANLGFRAPPHFNTADYVIDAVSIDYRSKALESNTKRRVKYLAKEAIQARAITNGNGHDMEHATGEDPAALGVDIAKTTTRKKFENSVLSELYILLSRTFRKMSRENQANITRVSQTIIFGILLGLIWLNTGRDLDNEANRRSVAGVLFFIAVNQGFDGAFTVIFDFPIERAVLTREQSSRSYRTFTYFLATLVINVLKIIIVNLLFVSLVYWMVGLRASASAYFFTIITCLLLGLTGEGIAQFISVFTGNAQASAALVPLVVVLAFLFGGFFIAPEEIPVFLRWGRYLSFLYWGYNTLAHNEFDSRDDPISQLIIEDFNDQSRWYVFVSSTLAARHTELRFSPFLGIFFHMY